MGGSWSLYRDYSFNTNSDEIQYADETKADRVGLELTARAGYDPRAGITMWKKMINTSKGGKPPEFLSTQPTDSRRIQQIQAMLPTVMPLYQVAQKRQLRM